MEDSELAVGKPLFPKRERFKFIFVLSLLLVVAATATAQAAGFGKYDVEAAYLSNFGKFVQWPSGTFTSPSTPIVLGVYGETPVNGCLGDIVRGKTINGRQIVLQPVSFNTVQNCQILFISPSERKNLVAVVRKLSGAGVLTVTENVDPSQSGAMINFVRKNRQILLEINDLAARQAGLKISSKLLSLATKITTSREIHGKPHPPA